MVVVDDLLPFNTKTGKLAFTQTNGNELWVPILEKAWAKLNGNYGNTKSGNTGDALTFMIPHPTVTYDHSEHRDFFDDMLDAFNHDKIVTTGSH